MFTTVEELDGRDLLSAWSWLLPKPLVPLRITAFGDVFAADESGTVYFLNARDARIERIGEGAPSIDRFLDSVDNRRTYLLSFIVRLLRGAGRTLSPGQCYSFRHPVHLGGEMAADNVEIVDVAVHLSILGQLHQQSR
jgi:hypothetical protein